MSLRVIILLLLFAGKIYGQCGTDVTNNHITNPSFENWDLCCPSTYSQVICSEGWEQGTTYGTSDFYNKSCNSFKIPAMPMSLYNNLPNGNGFMGALAAQDYHEYIAQCLSQPFLAGQQYTITLKIAGFGSDYNGFSCTNTPAFGPLNLVIYGGTCPTGVPGNEWPLPASYNPGCFTNSNWRLVASASYQPAAQWTTVTFTFTPTVNIYAIMFGPDCILPNSYDYNNDQCTLYMVYDDMKVVTSGCNDNNSCTNDQCINNQCIYTPNNCNDNNSCTTDQCQNSRCINTPVVCNDFNSCTTDVCVAGICRYSPRVCNDNNPCTVDICLN